MVMADRGTGSRGRVSVVIASARDEALVAACLQSVLPQARAFDAPVILARSGDVDAMLTRLGMARESIVTVKANVHVDAGVSIPALRGAGLAAVRTELAALIEDHCIAAPGWLAALSAAAADADFVGGRMGNAQRARAVDWAAFFAEYGFFGGSTNDGSPPLATAANVLYGPAALPRAAEWAAAGLWEDVIHARLLAAGCRLAMTQAAEMQQNQRYAVGAFCRDRFRHGFDYARVRLREQPSLARWARAITAPVLPIVLARRLSAKVAPPDRAAFVRASPLTMIFLSAWAIGEMAGYVRGPAPNGP